MRRICHNQYGAVVVLGLFIASSINVGRALKQDTHLFANSVNSGEPFSGTFDEPKSQGDNSVYGAKGLKMPHFGIHLKADRRTRIDLTLQFEFLYGSERHIEFQIRPKCFSDENKVRAVIDLKYSDYQMQLEPIMKTLRFYCISKQQSIREDSLPFSVKVSDKISRVRLKSSAFLNQATSNIQASYDGVWLRDTFVHKFLLPELYKHTSNPWQNKTRESLEEACRTKKLFCTPGDDFFPYIVWQILSNKKIVHVISNKAELIPQADALPDQQKTSLDCPYKIIADLEKLTFRTLNMQLTTSYAVNGVTEFGTKPGSQLAVFDFGMLEASIKWYKMPNAFLGTLATSFFHKLDVNGKGAATRSDRSAEWQISGDLGSGLYRFVNMFALKKLFSTLFPPLKTHKT